MKEFYIAMLAAGEEIQDFFRVKSIGIRTGSNKKPYLDLLLGDNTGEIGAKKWDLADAELATLSEIQPGQMIKVKAQVTEWNGLKQLRVSKVRRAAPQDDVAMEDFFKTAPEAPREMFAYLMEAVERMTDPELARISRAVLLRNEEKLLYYPAAMKNHHAEIGGLLYHMKRMTMLGEYCCLVYPNLSRDLLITGVLIHDIEKLRELMSDETGIVSGYSFEGQLLGHLVQGVKAIDRLAEELEIGREKAILLEHMALSHHYEPEYGSPKRPLFPEAEMLHYLDIIDARLYDMTDALVGVLPGEFSERVWTLDNRKIYQATFHVESATEPDAVRGNEKAADEF